MNLCVAPFSFHTSSTNFHNYLELKLIVLQNNTKGYCLLFHANFCVQLERICLATEEKRRRRHQLLINPVSLSIHSPGIWFHVAQAASLKCTIGRFHTIFHNVKNIAIKIKNSKQEWRRE